MEKKIYIHFPVLSQFGKLNLSYLDLSTKTGNQCLHQFDRDRIEFFILSSFSPDRYTNEFNLPAKIASLLSLQSFAIRSETASSSGASALHLGTMLIESGRFKTGMILATEVMSKLSREENNLLLGQVLSKKQISLCMSMAQGAGLITNRYLHDFGYSKKDLFSVAKKLHDNGLKNPISHIKKNLTLEEYTNAPIFSTPLGLYDISPLSDGSCSLILSSELRSEFTVKGIGSGIDCFYNQDAQYSFKASIGAFKKAYDDANLKPQNIEVAELHDAFTSFELIGAEDSGIFPRGKALQKVIEGETHPDGKIPINPSGGLKSRGHPIGVSGLAQIAEVIHFMKKNPKINLGLTHSIGGLATNNFATIIARS